MPTEQDRWSGPLTPLLRPNPNRFHSTGGAQEVDAVSWCLFLTRFLLGSGRRPVLCVGNGMCVFSLHYT